MKPSGRDALVFVHIGDLHLTDARQQNFRDYLAIVAQLATEFGPALDFVILPGDNADDGHPSQYALVDVALRMLRVPVHVIPGDHDMHQGGLSAFSAMECVDTLPKSLLVKGMRCLFLDMSGTGRGGPDFRLGGGQLAWLETELAAAAAAGQCSLLFMHTYPADLRGKGETDGVNRLIGAHDVALVDLGHTHYNELANDGATIYAATRSTGQIEEGPVGFSLCSVDAGCVSWRFKALDDAFPFVLITSPADHRLLRRPDQRVGDVCRVRARVFGRREVQRVVCRIDGSPAVAMMRAAGECFWSADVPIPDTKLASVTVEATDVAGRLGQHTVRAATRSFVLPGPVSSGSDAASIGAWPENGILATQLGPNRNGKPLF